MGFLYYDPKLAIVNTSNTIIKTAGFVEIFEDQTLFVISFLRYKKLSNID
jgi:hypothetical protein